MNMDYKVEIVEANREFNARERLMIKDFSNANQLDTLTDENPVLITPKDYAILKVHNEHSKAEKDYTKFMIIDTAGNKYLTGSSSFIKSFLEIKEEMGDDEEYSIEAYKVPSKNYQGKSFLTCSIV